MRRKLSSHDYVRIAAKAIVSPQTVRRLYDGRVAQATTRERVRRAAEQLGLPLPPGDGDSKEGAAA